MAGQFEGKVALVTGGGSGIGRATAIAFAQQGARVIVADINSESGPETVKQIKAAGGEATFVSTDVTKADEVAAMVDETVAAYGRLDFAHNNAGIDGDFAVTHAHTEENFDRVIAVNLKSVWLGMKYEIPQMLKQGGGVIINTASTAGLTGYRTMGIYVASKHGVIGLTKSAALEFSTKNIRILAVCPGAIRTPMIDEFIKGVPEVEASMNGLQPMGRMGRPEEVANVVTWLCSDAASFMTGAAIPIEGGTLVQTGFFPPVPE